LAAFHQALEGVVIQSAAFRLEELPFTQRSGYEDWYLVDNWAAFGKLNDTAVSGVRWSAHDAVAGLAQDGWAGVYQLVRERLEVPGGGHWGQAAGQGLRIVRPPGARRHDLAAAARPRAGG
jgi:hypothetical protein